jgi:hypothetical protein
LFTVVEAGTIGIRRARVHERSGRAIVTRRRTGQRPLHGRTR